MAASGVVGGAAVVVARSKVLARAAEAADARRRFESAAVETVTMWEAILRVRMALLDSAAWDLVTAEQRERSAA